MYKRTILQLSATLLSVLAIHTVQAQTLSASSRPLQIVVPYPAGGPLDRLARLVAPALGNELGRTVIVDNRAGASGIIGTGAVARTLPANGDTLLLVNQTTFASNPVIFDELPYDVEKDFTPVSQAVKFDMILAVNPEVLPASNLGELLALAKRTPEGLNFGTSGIGGTPHLLMELFSLRSGANLVPIHYKGMAPALQDLMAGHVSAMFLERSAAQPLIQSGRLRAIAVPGKQRLEMLPDVPTLDELGFPEVDIQAWAGFAMRSGTPENLVTDMARAYAKVNSLPDVQAGLASADMSPVSSTPEEFGNFIKNETQRVRELVSARPIKLE
ncbi:MAG: Bug family tripartite tricarboxylate transporter substrate binding protein [Pigmentiphaga sp.]